MTQQSFGTPDEPTPQANPNDATIGADNSADPSQGMDRGGADQGTNASGDGTGGQGETLGAPARGGSGDRSGNAGGGTTTQRDPDQWVTGDEPMTAAQRSYLDTLAKEAGETLPADLTKADASKHIDRLQGKSNRVQ